MLEVPAGSVLLADVLGGICREMAGLAQLASDLQLALGLAIRTIDRSERSIQTLQSLDLITQRLQGVADFLAVLAPSLPAAWTCDPAEASQALGLSDLARRLLGPEYAAEQAVATEIGAVELFEA